MRLTTATGERVVDTAVRHDAATMIKSLDNAVLGFAEGSDQPDDMTVVVIKRTGAGVAAADWRTADAASPELLAR